MSFIIEPCFVAAIVLLGNQMVMAMLSWSVPQRHAGNALPARVAVALCRWRRQPEHHAPLRDFSSQDDLDSAFAKMREPIGRARTQAMPHEEFIATQMQA